MLTALTDPYEMRNVSCYCMTALMHLQVHVGDHVFVIGPTTEGVRTLWILEVQELYNTREVILPGVFVA